ncbi:hypothetical protein A3D04_04055 [Candidatus Curtissbacteria bacterium RIFCSPHIGHO2_02_FULL_40_16b]|uniref:Soluble ligand binding domain-containing protein n=1 Tax=Candidatus Curtissbacteria bacterium RIFCSPHIGHO2_02_FULL_40_16b TaxID=1797714 RepID=A0A1F5G8I5_9BACT|nr:MAG: hypothetical protein A3D04_04055 [Candidatus Curtissbacteria bacterium RIFCSPHIGHO2_02_FULL_40_16b]
MSESLENFWENNKAKTAVVGMFLFGLFLLAFGVGTFALKDSGEDDAIKIISVEQGDPLNKIIVHVDGAVNKPGVYELTIDSRVNDLVAAAGGLTEDANTQAINLAAKLSDGQKAHIASINDPVSIKNPDTGSGVTGLINVNTASEAQLDTLPGVGPVTAGKIIASRPYSSVEELLSKKAVGRATFDKIKDLVTVY